MLGCERAKKFVEIHMFEKEGKSEQILLLLKALVSVEGLLSLDDAPLGSALDGGVGGWGCRKINILICLLF